MTKVKTYELRTKNKAELLKQLEELKTEMATLRVAKVTGGAASKLSKIGIVRKNIARVLTVISQNTRAKTRNYLKNKKYLPKDLRPKLTRAKRQALTAAEANETENSSKQQRIHFAVYMMPRRCLHTRSFFYLFNSLFFSFFD